MDSMPASLRDIILSGRVKHYPKNQIILYEGDKPPDVYIIKSGIVKIHDIDKQGNEKILHIVKTPGLIPFAFFSGQDIGTKWFYTALTDSDVYIVERSKIEEAMNKSPEIIIYFMNWFSREVHELLVRLSSLGKTNTKDKLIAVLKFLALCHSVERRSGWWRVSFPVSHQLLADMVGVTRESAASSMKELQDEGIVRNPRLTILEINFEKLKTEPYIS